MRHTTASEHGLTASDRLALVRDLYNKVYATTDSFAVIGTLLAYTMGAIANATGTLPPPEERRVQLDHVDSGVSMFVYVLIKAFPNSSHQVWSFVRLLDDEGDELPRPVQDCIVSGHHLPGKRVPCPNCHRKARYWVDALECAKHDMDVDGHPIGGG